jgi:transcriptional regulator with XRE-family HTH domain
MGRFDEGMRLREVLAANVRRMRKSRGWTQEAFADVADLHRTQVGAIERGEKDVRLGTLAKLSTALQIHAAELLSD